MTASLTNLNVHGMDQTGEPSFCPSLSSFIIAKELPYDVEQSESKVLHMVIFHISLHCHVDKGCLDIGVVVSLTSLDMMLLILAHALVEMNCQILSLFTKIISSPQKFKRMLPTCTAPPTH